MERRDRSLEALSKLRSIDGLGDDDIKASQLDKWVTTYLNDNGIEKFDLNKDSFKILSELLYKNIQFMKQHRVNMKQQIDNHKKIREFLK